MGAQENMDEVRSRLTIIDAKLDMLLARAGPEIASDRDLDGPRGDPEIKRAPKRWTGKDYVGKRYSESEPAFLEEVASFNDWRASEDDKKREFDDKGRLKSTWARRDAALARGWARRMRATATLLSPASGSPAANDGAGDFGESPDDTGGF